MNKINIIIHLCDYAFLGGENQWNWKQYDISAPYWRLYWNEQPGGFIKVGELVFELKPDAVFLMPPMTVYSTWTENAFKHFYIHFSANDPLDKVKSGFFRLDDSRLLEMTGETLELFLLDRESWQNGALLQRLILSALLRLPEGTVMPHEQYDCRIQKALELMLQSNNVSNRILAKHTGMSVNSFLTLFRDEVGLPPQAWSRKKRLEQAGELLHFREASIDDIADDTGFCDRYHFSRAFKKQFGASPAQYRQQIRKLRDFGRVCGSRGSSQET